MLKIGFLGQYEHSLDEKGRVSIPSKYKKYVEKVTEDPEHRSTVVAVKGKDKCIEVFPVEDWAKLLADFSQGAKLDDRAEDRAYVDSKFRNADYMRIDKSGRVLLPPVLKEYAGISKNVVITGAGDRFKIWDAGQLKEFDKKHGGA